MSAIWVDSLVFARGESAENQVTLRQILECINKQIRKLSDQNEACETRRQTREKK